MPAMAQASEMESPSRVSPDVLSFNAISYAVRADVGGCIRDRRFIDSKSKLRELEILRPFKPVYLLCVGSNCGRTKGLPLAALYL